MTIKLSKTKFDQLVDSEGDYVDVECRETGRELVIHVLGEDDEDEELIRWQLDNGISFGPAGLVKLTDEQKAAKAAALTGVSPAEWVDAVRREKERLLQQIDEELCAQAPYAEEEDVLSLQAESLPGPIGRTDLLEERAQSAYTPQIGEVVVVAVDGSVYGTTEWNGKPLLGQKFYVISSVLPGAVGSGRPVVWLDTDPVGDGLVVVETADLLPLSAV